VIDLRTIDVPIQHPALAFTSSCFHKLLIVLWSGSDILAVLDTTAAVGIDVQTPDIVLEVVRQVVHRGRDLHILLMLAPRAIIIVNDVNLLAAGGNLDGVHVAPARF